MSERADEFGIVSSLSSPAHERHTGRGEYDNDNYNLLSSKNATVASGQPPVTLTCSVRYFHQAFVRLSVYLEPKNKRPFYVYFPADTITVEYDHPDAQLRFGKTTSKSPTCVRFGPKKPGLLVGPRENDDWTPGNETSRGMLEALYSLAHCPAFTVCFPALDTHFKRERAPSAGPIKEVETDIRSLYGGRGGRYAASALSYVLDWEPTPTGPQSKIVTKKRPHDTASTKGARSAIETARPASRSALTLPSFMPVPTLPHARPVNQLDIGSTIPDTQPVSDKRAVADSDECSLQDTQAFEGSPLQDTLVCETNPLQDTQVCEASTGSVVPGTGAIESASRVTPGRGLAPETADWAAPPPRHDVDRLASMVSKPSCHVDTHLALSRAAFSDARRFSTPKSEEQKEVIRLAANGEFDEHKIRSIVKEELEALLNKDLEDIIKRARQEAQKGVRQRIREAEEHVRQKAKKRVRQNAEKGAWQRIQEAKERFRQKAKKRVRHKAEKGVRRMIREVEEALERLRQEMQEAKERGSGRTDNEMYKGVKAAVDEQVEKVINERLEGIRRELWGDDLEAWK